MSENPGMPPRKRRFTFGRIVFLCFSYLWVGLLLGISVVAVFGFIAYDHVIQPGHPGQKVEITIPEGATGRDVGRILTENGLIEREGFFRLAVKLDASKGIIRHGAYELPRGLSARELLKLLYDGPSKHLLANQVKITIPEGLSAPQVAALLDDPTAFLAAASDPTLIARLGIEEESVEGFLMPNTYFFDDTPTARVVVERMVGQFEKEYAALVAETPGAEVYDKMSVVTVAALVEEEARVDDERAKVAAVIYNRLDRGMPLQMDSTLQYALGKYGKRMLSIDKEVDSPYNTYLHAGLPPGPISSPGAASLRAALRPASVSHLYFVSNADGKTHTFSDTAAEHERAVARYRREIAAKRRAQKTGN